MTPPPPEREQRLLETEAILDALPHPTIAMDESFRIVRLNEAALAFIDASGYGEVIGEPCYKRIYNRSEICPYCHFHHHELSEPSSEIDSVESIIQVRNDSGEEEALRLSFYTVSVGSIRRLEVIENITREREKQEEALRIENLAALGTMISGISHELNNPLTGMGLTLQNLEANLGSMSHEEIIKRIRMLRKDLSRAARIVADILSFARPNRSQTSYGDLLLTVEKARSTTIRLYPVLASRIDWIIEGEADPIPLQPEKIERLLINLFRNSLQAFDYAPGVIRIELRQAKRQIHLIVEDNAGGITADKIKQVFNPFYTASRDGRGSGLGLTICHSIVKEHSGRIRVWSGFGRTKFYISLPRQNDHTQTAENGV